MSEDNNDLSPEILGGLLDEENIDLNLTPTEINLPEQEIVELQEGLEVLKDQVESDIEDEQEELSDEDLAKLVQFTTGIKNLSKAELEEIRGDEKELERLIRISVAKSRHITYNPKKNFGTAYKKKRQKKNKQARRSRAVNRR